MAVLSDTEVKSYLNITSSAHDSQLTAFINRAQKQAENYCNQHFESQNVTHYFDGLGSDIYVLPFREVTAVGTLSYRQKPTDAWTDADSGDVVLMRAGKLFKLYFSRLFQYGYFYKLQITSGYSIFSIPEDLKQIIIEMVAIMYSESKLDGESRLAISSITNSFAGEGKTTNFLDLWTNRWKPLLNTYRVPTV